MQQWAELDVSQLTPHQIQGAMAVAIAIGTVYCFLGYRAFRFVIGLTGFLLAGSFAAGLAGWVSGGKLLYMGIAGILGGIAGAVALFFIYKLGVVFLGAIAGALIAHSVLGGRPESWVIWAIIGSALFGGLSALLLERAVMTVATAAIGACLAVYALAFFIVGAGSTTGMETATHDDGTTRMLVICWVVLALVGTVAQFATHRKKERAK